MALLELRWPQAFLGYQCGPWNYKYSFETWASGFQHCHGNVPRLTMAETLIFTAAYRFSLLSVAAGIHYYCESLALPQTPLYVLVETVTGNFGLIMWPGAPTTNLVANVYKQSGGFHQARAGPKTNLF